MDYILLCAKNYWNAQQATHSAQKFQKYVENLNITKSISTLYDDDLNVNSFISAYKNHISYLKEPNTHVIIVMLGHGNQFNDQNGDEEDGKDEGYQLPDGVILDDTLSLLLNEIEIHETSLFILISDHCSSGTMLDERLIDKNKNYINIASSYAYEDSYESGDGNVMLINLLEYLKKEPTIRDIVNDFPIYMANSFIGELQHVCITISSDKILNNKLF